MSPSTRRDTISCSPWCRSAWTSSEEISSGCCIIRPFMGCLRRVLRPVFGARRRTWRDAVILPPPERRSGEGQLPGFPDEVVAEAGVRFARDQTVAGTGVDGPGGDEHAVGPEQDPAVAPLAGEAG